MKLIDLNLEKKFIHYLELTFNKILDFPDLYQYEDIIMILTIFHTSRNPINLQD